MSKITKSAVVLAFALTTLGVLSAAAVPEVPEKRTQLIETHAMIQDEFSGLEAKPIVKAFVSWMNETRGDILVLPPAENDSLFYDLAVKGEGGDFNVFNMDLRADGSSPDPWDKGCRHSFFVLRVNSKDPIVKALDGENRQIMAFTFTGCTFKFIAVVADRMKSEEMLYTTMLHELGHMWGLPDNKEGSKSVMAGVYPGAPCITKRDLQRVYSARGRRGMAPKDGGCVPLDALDL